MLVFLASYMLINSESGVQGDYVIIMIPLERPARTVISARESNGTQRRERISLLTIKSRCAAHNFS